MASCPGAIKRESWGTTPGVGRQEKEKPYIAVGDKTRE